MPTAQTTAVAALTTTEAAVLALLAIEGERSGYDLTKLVAQAIAHVWSPARSGLYAVLPAARAGRARAAARRRAVVAARQAALPHHARGARALDDWLETVEPGARESFFLKLFVGGLTSRRCCSSTSQQFRADTEARLESYRAIEPTNSNRGHDWYHRHLLRLGIEQAEQELAWADSVGRALRRGPR